MFNKIENAFYIVTHPVSAVKVARRRIVVSTEEEAPPHTSTWEDFPNLSIRDAAQAVKEAKQSTRKK